MNNGLKMATNESESLFKNEVFRVSHQLVSSYVHVQSKIFGIKNKPIYLFRSPILFIHNNANGWFLKKGKGNISEIFI